MSVDKNSISPSCQDGKKKIGDVNLKGIIDGIEINCTVDLSFHKTMPNDNNETKRECKKLTKRQWMVYFITPLFVVIVGFFIDSFIDTSHHLTLFISPLAFGFMIYKMVINSSNVNIQFFKKLVDATGLLSSTLSASILIFKTINVENPYISMLAAMKDTGVLYSIIFYLIMALVYIIIWVFAASITIKLMITYDELVVMKEKT